MSQHSSKSRRGFLKKLTGSALLLASGLPSSAAHRQEEIPLRSSPAPTADKIRLGVIGAGIMGFNNLETALTSGFFECKAVCDLYEGHLQKAREVLDPKIFTTKDYQQVLSRTDIDAVIIATTDHWHDKISIDAMKAGKSVYCEKPMVHKWEEGREVIDIQQQTKVKFQVGSQRVSSILTEKAAQLYRDGEIGQLIMAEAWFDRQSALGAWQYAIPTDASVQSVDWERYQGDAPKQGFDPMRFFRWRNYQAYGTGVAGDLFVHLFSGLHAITGSKGPNRAFATGGLRYWKDGRDVPDVMAALFDYPESDTHPAFTLQMRVNFVDGSGGSQKIRLIGSEGVMELEWSSVKITKSKIPEAPGFGGWDTYNTFSAAQQKEYERWYEETYPAKRAKVSDPKVLEFTAPRGYSDHLDHWVNFAEAIRSDKPIVEDALFGMQAAGPALLANLSYFEQKVVHWDPKEVRVVKA